MNSSYLVGDPAALEHSRKEQRPQVICVVQEPLF